MPEGTLGRLPDESEIYRSRFINKQFKTWPLGQIPEYLQRPELSQIKSRGYSFNDPFEVVRLFEEKVAKFAGAKYAVAVDSCSNGLFLALKYHNARGTIIIPKHTYFSVPMQIMHAGCGVKFEERDWAGRYRLEPYPIWDAAIQWRKNMFSGETDVVSFQIKKAIPIGRGGMILTNNREEAAWYRRACHDGRNMSVSYVFDEPIIGWHCYMIPEDAARGILLMDELQIDTDDRRGMDVCIDISSKEIFNGD